jgi:hypothetical protein
VQFPEQPLGARLRQGLPLESAPAGAPASEEMEMLPIEDG